MIIRGNTVLITGGESGIGRGLAESFYNLGNEVVIAGRNLKALAEVDSACPGIDIAHFDQSNAASIADLVAQLVRRHPKLNILINNAGVQQREDLSNGNLEAAENAIATNLLGPIRLTAGFMSTLLANQPSAILNVTSALGFVPQAITPTYSATKAALHSYTQSLRSQLRDKRVDVIEIIPPFVQTRLQGDYGMSPNAMPLAAFIGETMSLLAEQPAKSEIIVERARAVRFAERNGTFDAIFSRLNDSAAAE